MCAAVKAPSGHGDPAEHFRTFQRRAWVGNALAIVHADDAGSIPNRHLAILDSLASGISLGIDILARHAHQADEIGEESSRYLEANARRFVDAIVELSTRDHPQRAVFENLRESMVNMLERQCQ